MGDGAALQLPGVMKGPLAGHNVLLIVIDTLGAKHVGAAGKTSSPTPNIDRLAEGGVTFQRAYSTAPWTQPAVASLFTGRMPSDHGVQNLLDVLAPEALTLAEILAAVGYRNHGAVSHFLVTKRFGYAQGFQSFNERSVAGHEGISSERLANHAIDWLKKRAGRERPFFLFVHFFDPHFRYHAHPEFGRTPKYDGPIHAEMDVWDLRNLRPSMTADDIAYLTELYREEVAYTDHHVGRILDALSSHGQREKTLVIVTADHGEEFLEHGWIGHTRSLYDELLRVPLIFSAPGALPARTIAAPVSTLDLFPTVIDLLLGTEGKPSLRGVALSAALLGRTDEPPEHTLFAEVSFTPHVEDARASEKTAFKTAAITADWKLVHDIETDRFEVYPAQAVAQGIEDEDAYGRDGARDAHLRALLERFELERQRPRAPDAEAGSAGSDADLEVLRGLGYLGEDD